LSGKPIRRKERAMDTKRWRRKTERVATAAALVVMMAGSWTLPQARADRGGGVDRAKATSTVPRDPDQIRRDLSAAGMDVTSPGVRQLIKNLAELGDTFFE
jgi:hypothetical protein